MKIKRYKHLTYLLLIPILGVVSCNKTCFLNGTYKGISNNPKVLIEYIKFLPDFSYHFHYSIYDVGLDAVNFEYIGKYKLEKDKITFSLDSIKSHNTRMIIPGEKRPDKVFDKFEVNAVNLKQQKDFQNGELRIKSEYLINRSCQNIIDRNQDRFVKINKSNNGISYK